MSRPFYAAEEHMTRNKYPSLVERIIANSVMTGADFAPDGTPCWIWTGSRKVNNRGTPYPRMTVRVKGKPRGLRVHRLVLQVFKGVELQADMVAAHVCNKTMCVSPGHLALVTQVENMQQCVRDGRHRGYEDREPGDDDDE